MAYNRIYNDSDWELVNRENKDIMEDFLLEYKSRKKKESTLKQYRNDLRIILIYILKNCDNKSITDLSKKDFRRLSLWFSDDLEVSNARTNRLMSCVRSLLTFVEDEDEYDYDNNVAKKVRGLEKEPVREIVFLTNEEVEALRDKFMKEERYKDAMLISLLYDSAARKNEVSQVEKFSFIEGKDATNIVVGKRGKKFPLIYFDWSKEAFEKYIEQRGEDDIPNLFILGLNEDKRPAKAENIYDWVISWRKDFLCIFNKKKDFNVHSFRHSALECYSTGSHYYCKKLGIEQIPLEKLKLIANHNSVETTAGYLQDKSTEVLEELFGIKIN